MPPSRRSPRPPNPNPNPNPNPDPNPSPNPNPNQAVKKIKSLEERAKAVEEAQRQARYLVITPTIEEAQRQAEEKGP